MCMRTYSGEIFLSESFSLTGLSDQFACVEINGLMFEDVIFSVEFRRVQRRCRMFVRACVDCMQIEENKYIYIYVCVSLFKEKSQDKHEIYSSESTIRSK